MCTHTIAQELMPAPLGPFGIVNTHNILNRNSTFTQGLVSFWRATPGLDGGTKLYDAYARNDCALTGAVTCGGTFRQGGDAEVRFTSPAGPYLDCGAVNIVIGGTGSVYTISLWTKLTNVAGSQSVNQTFLSNFDVTGAIAQYDFQFKTSNASPTFELQYGDGTNYRNMASGTALLSAEVWYHIVWVNGGNSDAAQVLYLNGISQSLTPSNTGTPTDIVTTGFGNTTIAHAGSYPSGSIDGSIDEVLVFTRILSALDVMELYNHNRQGDVSLVNRVMPNASSIATIISGGGAGKGFFPFFR